MKKMNMIWTKIAALALGAVMALGIGVTVISVSPISEAEAATTQTHRRIYVKLAGGWDNVGKMYIHYWGGTGGGTNWGSLPEMTNVLPSYYSGLFIFDLPVGTTTFMVNAYSGDTAEKNKSVDINVADLFIGSNYKIASIGAWVADNQKRSFTAEETLPVSSSEAASVLNHIDSCSSSYASGYNSWPQLNDLIISSSTLDGNTVVTDNFGPDTTISAKTAYLEARYNADQPSSAQNVLAPIDDKNRITITVLFSIIGLSLVGGLYFYSRKKQSSI